MREQLDKSVRLTVAHHMRDREPIRTALLWVKQNPKGFAERVDTFDAATFDISTSTVLKDFKAKEMPNLSAFRRFYLKSKMEPINLSDGVFSYAKFLQEDPTDKFFLQTNTSMQEARKKLFSGEWSFHPDVFSSPNTFLARLLVEGFALNMEGYYNQLSTADKYKRALTEVLIKSYPMSVLTNDVLWWEKLEADQSRLVSLAEYENLKKERQSDPLKSAADRLNKYFREDIPAYEVLEDMKKFPRPILIDFNNVIANNRWPLKLNPDASIFLDTLREMGNIFIVTSASGWRQVQGFMVEQGIWHPDMVLMTAPTYEFISSWQERNPEGIKLRQKYLEITKNLRRDCIEEDLFMPPGYKRIAPMFCKPWEIPFIDNDVEVTHKNPGIFGILVKEWVSEEEKKVWDNSDMKWFDEKNEKKFTLAEAVNQVRKHYSKIAIP